MTIALCIAILALLFLILGLAKSLATALRHLDRLAKFVAWYASINNADKLTLLQRIQELEKKP